MVYTPVLHYFSWLYRIRPAVLQSSWKRVEQGDLVSNFEDTEPNPEQVRKG